jgi:integrase
LFRYSYGGKSRHHGLGGALTFNLAEAREIARARRQDVLAGRDPISQRAGGRTTFDKCFQQFWAIKKLEISSLKMRVNYESSVLRYASPVLGARPVDQITTAHVLEAIEPIWLMKHKSARMLLGRIGAVLDYAIAKRLRSEGNPAAWKVIGKLLADPKRVARVKHMSALPYAELPAFMVKLREAQGDANLPTRALEFAILVACRTGDINGQPATPGEDEKPPLRWTDLDLDGARWRIPNPKASIPHDVALPDRAVAILREVQAWQLPGDIVFPIGRDAMLKALGAIRPSLTVHGFRASFRTWGGKETVVPREIIEEALAHDLIADEVEKAYIREDINFEKRRPLMQAWADHVSGKGAKVTRMPSKAAEADVAKVA